MRHSWRRSPCPTLLQCLSTGRPRPSWIGCSGPRRRRGLAAARAHSTRPPTASEVDPSSMVVIRATSGVDLSLDEAPRATRLRSRVSPGASSIGLPVSRLRTRVSHPAPRCGPARGLARLIRVQSAATLQSPRCGASDREETGCSLAAPASRGKPAVNIWMTVAVRSEDGADDHSHHWLA